MVDPYATGVASKADIHLRPRPGTDGAMCLGMMHWIVKNDLWDKEFVENHTVGFDELAKLTEKWTPEYTEEITTISKEQLIETAQLLAVTESHFEIGYGQQRYSNGHQSRRALACLAGLCGSYGKRAATITLFLVWDFQA